MSTVHVAVSALIDAEPDIVYRILADYQQGHPHILPKRYFSGLEVEQGGYGEGTIVKATMRAFGGGHTLRMRITEPQPGRVLAETDIETGVVTTFTVTPSGAGTETTIATSLQLQPGLRGAVERVVTPWLLRRVYREELQQLNDYAQRLRQSPLPPEPLDA